jgi:hypothetical protein
VIGHDVRGIYSAGIGVDAGWKIDSEYDKARSSSLLRHHLLNQRRDRAAGRVSLAGPKKGVDNDSRFAKGASKIILRDNSSAARLRGDLSTARDNDSARKGSKLKETISGIPGRVRDNGRNRDTLLSEPTSYHQSITPVISGATEDENRGN